MSEDAELQILRAARGLLDNLPKGISRGCDLNRTMPVSESTDLPRLFVGFGDDAVIEDGLAYSDNRMELVVIAVVRDTDPQFTESLSRIRAAVHQALMSDRQLGRPDLVMDVRPQGAVRPQMPDRERASMPGVYRELSYAVDYRTQAGDRTQGGSGAPT